MNKRLKLPMLLQVGKKYSVAKNTLGIKHVEIVGINGNTAFGRVETVQGRPLSIRFDGMGDCLNDATLNIVGII